MGLTYGETVSRMPGLTYAAGGGVIGARPMPRQPGRRRRGRQQWRRAASSADRANDAAAFAGEKNQGLGRRVDVYWLSPGIQTSTVPDRPH